MISPWCYIGKRWLERAIAATVHATEEHNGLRLASHHRRSPIELMLAPVDAEVDQFEFVNDHALFFPASGVA